MRLGGLEGITGYNEQVHWRMQKVRTAAVILTALILTAALIGLFGGGPISSAVAVDPETSTRIEYPRFARLSAPVHVMLYFSPRGKAGSLEVQVDASYLEAFKIESISPAPAATRIGSDTAVLVFDAAGPGRVRFDLEPVSAGYIQGRVQVSPAVTLTIRQVVFP